MHAHDWKTVNQRSRALTQTNASRFCALMQTTPNSPVNDDFIAQLFSIPINIAEPEKLHDLLYQQYLIQVPVPSHEGQYYLRYSIQGFNQQDDLDKLYQAMEELVSLNT